MAVYSQGRLFHVTATARNGVPARRQAPQSLARFGCPQSWWQAQLKLHPTGGTESWSNQVISTIAMDNQWEMGEAQLP